MSLQFFNPVLLSPISPASIVAESIVNAYTNLGFNDEYSKVFSSYYINKNASISGVVSDEVHYRDATRPELTCRATTFTTNQRFVSDSTVTGTGKTALSVGVWVRPEALSGSKAIIGEYLATGNQRSWLLRFNDAKMYVQISETGNVITQKIYENDTDLSVDQWYHLAFTFDSVANELKLFIDGKEAGTTSTQNNNLSSIFDTTQPLEIASLSNNLNHLKGQIQFPCIWESVLTPAQVRDLYLDDLANVPTPDHAWILDGDKAWTIAGDSVLSPSNTPTRSESEDNPKSSNDFNHAGWSNPGTFDGVDDYVEIDSAADQMSMLSDFSGQIVFRLNDSSAAGQLIASTRTSSDRFAISHTAGIIRVGVYDGSTHTSVGKPLTDTNSFHTLEWSYDSTLDVMTATLDGAAVTNINNTGNVSTAGTNIGARSDGAVLFDGQIALVEIDGGSSWGFEDGSGLTVTDSNGLVDGTINGATSDEFWATIVPAQWGSSTLDAIGGSLQYTGQVARNGQLEDGPCVDLDGVNQYGTITNTDDYSGEDWTLSIRFKSDGIAGTDTLFQQVNGSGNGRVWLRIKSTLRWSTFIGGADDELLDIDDVITGKEYLCTIEKSGSSFTFTVYNLTDETSSFETVTKTMEASDGDFLIGSSQVPDNYFEGKIWGLQLDCTSDPDKSFNCPINDEKGTVSKDISGNGKDIAWQNSPSLSGTQDSYFHGEAYGCNSVPIFDNSSELDGPTLSFLGSKTAEFEVDFYRGDTTGPQCITQYGSVSPLRVYLSSNTFQITYRDSLGDVKTADLLATTINTLYRLRVEVVEDDASPTTDSYILVYDRDTNVLLGSQTNLDLLMSTDNSALVTIGTYNAGFRFENDLYRLKTTIGGVEQILWNSSNIYLNETTGTNDFSESGGTLDSKKIPAKEDGSNTDANGYPIQNTSPSHRNTQATLRGYLANSDSEADIYYSSENDGLGSISLDSTITLSGAFEIDYEVYSDNFDKLGMILGNDITDQKIGFTNATTGFVFFRIISAGSSDATIDKPLADEWHTFKLIRDSSDVCSVIIDGTTYSLFSGAAQTGNLVLNRVYRVSDGQRFEGQLKNLKIIDDGTTVLDMPLYKDVLDRPPSCNHGIIAEAGITFNSNPATEIAALNPTITATETLDVTDGNKKLISIGQK